MGLFGYAQKLFRIEEWLHSVFPLVLSAPLYCVLGGTTGPSAQECAPLLVRFALFVAAFLSFGYLINDFCDKEDDRAVGKVKVVYDLPDSVVVSLLIALALLGATSIIAGSDFSPSLLGMVVLTYFLGAAYSTPFIRAKELGVWGLVISSFAQRGMPLFVAMALFDMSLRATMMWVTITFLDGLRYILIHQLIDLQNDLQQGVKTFATNHGPRLLRWGIVVALVAELAFLLFGIVLPVIQIAPRMSMTVLLAYVVLAGLLYAIFVRVFGKRDVLYTFDLVPLELFLNLVVPCTACLIIARDCPVYYVGFAMLLSIGLVPLADKCTNLRYARNLW